MNGNKFIKEAFVSIGISLIIGASIAILFDLYFYLELFRQLLTNFSKLMIIPCVIIGIFASYFIVQKLTAIKLTGCGTSQVIEAYHYRKGIISIKDSLSKTLASVVTIGLGGSAGLEGPSLLLGGGIASTIAQKIHLEDIRTFMLSGAAAGLAAIFRAPLTGILFALEIPFKKDLAKNVFVPASISSVTSYLTFVSIRGGEPLFPFIPTINVSLSNTLYAAVEGVLAAIVGVIFIAFFRVVELKILEVKNRSLLPFIGGFIIGAIGLIYPEVLGIGYSIISLSSSGRFYKASMLFLLMLLILKIIATTITLNFGGSGGLFIPSIFVGAILGSIYTKLLNLGSNEVLVMAAMGAVIATTNKTLLTSIAFVAETCGPSSIIPTVIAACISYLISGNWSFYEAQLPKEVEEEEKALSELYYLARHGFIKEAEKIKVEEAMKKNPIAIHEDISIKEAFTIIAQHEFRVYPIVDNKESIIGVINVEDLLAIPIEKWHLPISQVSIKAVLTVLKEDSIYKVIEKMMKKDQDHAYVVLDEQSMKLIGVISGIDIIKELLKRVTTKI
jgi:CIC family chloride channel protein